MMRSLYSGVTGLRNHQTRMDVIGNNISNVNTVGFKASRTTFQDLYSQTLTPASAPTTTGIGGTNPRQVGLGMTLASIDMLFTQSAQQYSGNPLDIYLNGEGFLIINDGTETYYTRAGNLCVDHEGNLLTSDGLRVMGGGTTTPPGAAAPIQIDLDNYYDIEIGQNGMIVGKDRTTGVLTDIDRLLVATFPNQQGLTKVGGNKYSVSANSGQPDVGMPGVAGKATTISGSLEMSNVDIANEFVDMIVTQRGLQANTRVITVSDQILEEIVNIKR